MLRLARGDFHELIDGELDVLVGGTLRGEDEGAVKSLAKAVVDALPRPDPAECCPFDDEMAGAAREANDDIFVFGELDQGLVVDGIDIAATEGRNRHGLGFREGRHARGRRGLFPQLFRPQAVDPFAELFAHRLNDRGSLNRDGDVVDEVDQHGEAHDRQNHAQCDGQMRDKGGLVRPTDRPQHEQAVDERGHKGAEDYLGCRVLHKRPE